ncbi:hypothetical protein [Reichenbachiella sp.]|uniref:DUF7829 domain-containing protein n=1 Tax=Reichenbachiella sp. TaxID=2184521 RepID=UPI003BB1562A
MTKRDDRDIINEIIELKSETQDIQRGIDFEILIRELPSWQGKPFYKPKSRRTKKDQLDAFFTWNGNSFLIEAKAEKKPMRPGSEKWKSYVSKLTDRTGLGVIGIFASLYDVDPDLYEDGDYQNVRGNHNFILAGGIWEELISSGVSFEDLLDFMVQEVRANLKSKPPKLKKIFEQSVDKEAIKDLLLDDSNLISNIFLRRYEHHHHNELYVARNIDNQAIRLIQSTRPSMLAKKKAKEFYDSIKQTHLIRDYSGSGKTTFCVNISKQIDICVPLCISASENDIDKILHNIIYKKESGGLIQKLRMIDQPLVVVIDSLDEVKNTQSKIVEVKSIFKLLEGINIDAEKHKLSAFPILVFFTIRDEYFKEWESLFEGSIDNVFRKKISSFSDSELDLALDKYCKTYNISINNIDSLDSQTRDVLSIPINLEIFSRANKYKRNIHLADIWESELLHSYFEEKDNQLHKRNLGIRHSQYFYALLADIAVEILQDKDQVISKVDFERILSHIDSTLNYYVEPFWVALVSEGIFILDKSRINFVSFRYVRFLEFMIAYKLVFYIKKTGQISKATGIINNCLKFRNLSIFKIVENLKYLCTVSDVPETSLEKFRLELVSNVNFIKDHLISTRSKIALGEVSPPESIKWAMLGASISQEPEVAWNAFYIITSKHNNQPKEVILEYFSIAWNKNPAIRYKMLLKIASHNLLTNETLVRNVFSDSQPREWETFLGLVIEHGVQNEFLTFWSELNYDQKLNLQLAENEADWKQCVYLVDVIKGKRELILGASDNELDTSSNKKSSLKVRKNIVSEAYQEVLEMYNTSMFLTPKNPLLNELEKEFLTKQLDSFFCTKGKPVEMSLVEYFAKNDDVRFLCTILKHEYIEVDQKLIIDVVDNITHFGLFEITDLIIYTRDFISKTDEIINKCNGLIDQNGIPDELAKLATILYSFRLDDLDDISYFHHRSRQFLTIASIVNDKRIANNLPNIVSIVNNGLQHYKDITPYILKALEVYDQDTKIRSKPSVQKKIEECKDFTEALTPKYTNIVRKLFPELV